MPSFERPQKPDDPAPERSESAGQRLIHVGLQGLKEHTRITPEFPTQESNFSVAEDIRCDVEAIFTGICSAELLPIEKVRPLDNTILFGKLISSPPERYTQEDVRGSKLYIVELDSLPLQRMTLFLPLEGSILRVDHDDFDRESKRLRLEKIYSNPDHHGYSFTGDWALHLSKRLVRPSLTLFNSERQAVKDQTIIQQTLRESAIEIYSGINAMLPKLG